MKYFELKRWIIFTRIQKILSALNFVQVLYLNMILIFQDSTFDELIKNLIPLSNTKTETRWNNSEDGLLLNTNILHHSQVVHDCRNDSAALYFQYDILVKSVFDTQVKSNSCRPIKFAFNKLSAIFVSPDPFDIA